MVVAVAAGACSPGTEPVGQVDPSSDTSGGPGTDASADDDGDASASADDTDDTGASSGASSADDPDATDGVDSSDTGTAGECPEFDAVEQTIEAFAFEPQLSVEETFERECTITVPSPITVACPDLSEPELAVVFDPVVELPPFEVGQTVRVEYASAIHDEWVDEWIKIEAISGSTEGWIAAGQGEATVPPGLDSLQWFGITAVVVDALTCPTMECTDGSGGQVSLARLAFGETEVPLWPGESAPVNEKDEDLVAYALGARRGVCSNSAAEQNGWYVYAFAGTALVGD
jgi:hypothetical protein